MAVSKRRQLDLFDRQRKPEPTTARGAQPQRAYRVAGLFAGIGGFELGLAAAGHETEILCEIDAAAKAVLGVHFAGRTIAADIRQIEALPGSVDLVAAGFPCQDLSQAGRTAGIDGDNSGLVREVLRLLRAPSVSTVVIENVPFMLRLARGAAMELVVTELESLGFRWAYRVVDSRSFGLPQRRERVYLVASRDVDPRSIILADEAGVPDGLERRDDLSVPCGFYWTEGIRGLGWATDCVPTLKGGSTIGIPSPPAILFPDGRLVKPHIRDAERLQGFRKDWTRPAEAAARPSARWKLIGNAVSVPVARWIGRRLSKPGAFAGDFEMPLLPGVAWPRVAWNVGSGRRTTTLSSWPCRYEPKPLAEFLTETLEPLSERATRGFLSRTAKSSLRFPKGFLKAVEEHLLRVS